MEKSVLYIVNPISGNARKKRAIVSILRGKGCNLRFTSCAGDAVDIARNASEDTIVAVGGDGTVNEVARGIAGTGKTLGIIPCGSGDGLARHLGIRGRFSRMVSIIEEGHTAALDWGTIDGKPFFSVCGVGLDAIVSERFARAGKRGLETYVKEALATWKDFKPDHYIITVDGVRIETDAVLITVGNSSQWGNGAKITPLARTDDGLLDVSIVKMFKDLEIPALVTELMTGTINRNKHVICLKGKEITIERNSAGPCHFDGDFTDGGKTVEIRLQSDPLRVIVPSSYRCAQ